MTPSPRRQEVNKPYKDITKGRRLHIFGPWSLQRHLHQLLFRSADDLFLVVTVKIDEVIAVTGHPDQQVAVFVGVFLGGAQGLGIDDIELDVMAAEGEIGADKAAQLVKIPIGGEYAGEKALIEQCAPRLQLIHLAERFDHRRRAVAVGTMGWRGAVRFRQTGDATVGGGAEHFAEVDMAGGGQHVQVVGRPLGVRFAVDGGEQRIVDSLHKRIGTVVVVAEKRRLVPEP